MKHKGFEFLTGNQAAALAAKLAKVEVIAVYPITPQTQIVEDLSRYVSEGALKAECVKVESELSAMEVASAAAKLSARVFTATSSQGLLLMDQPLYEVANNRLPIVMCNVNRSLAMPWNIWGGHLDSLSRRDSGWLQFYCKNNQEVLDFTIMAFKIAETCFLPVMVNLDGFLLSHTSEIVRIPEQDLVDRFLGKCVLPHRIDFSKPSTWGSSSSPNYYFGMREDQNRAINDSLGAIREVFREFNELFGRQYRALGEYRNANARISLLGMGSLAEVIEEAVDELRNEGIMAGGVNLRLFRPLPKELLRRALRGKTAIIFDVNERHIVLDEARIALYGCRNLPEIYGKTVGVGGTEVSVDFIKRIVREILEKHPLPNRFERWRRAGTGRISDLNIESEWRLDGPTPIVAAHADVEIKENTCGELITSGHRACQGCGAIHAMKFPLQVLGPKTIICLPACCWSIIAGPYPFTPLKVSLIHCLFESAAASASGISRALKVERVRKLLGVEEDEINIVAFAGDGGTFDIGIQGLSGATERQEDILYICYNNQGYMNTGRQYSSSTPDGAHTETTIYPDLKNTPKKNMLKIMAAHNVVYAATASVGYPDDLQMKIKKAMQYKNQGVRFIHILAPCTTGWIYPPDQTIILARLAVQSRIFPLVEYEKGIWRVTLAPDKKPVDEYIKKQGRFRHLSDDDIARIQEKTDDDFEEWMALESFSQNSELNKFLHKLEKKNKKTPR